MKRKIVEATVYGYGIPPRCRKVQRCSMKLGEYSPDAVPEAELIDKARRWGTTLKQPNRLTLSLQPMEVGEENGFSVRSFMLFGSDSKRIPIEL